MKKRIRQLLGYLLVAICLIAGGKYFTLVNHYALVLPRSPQTQSGQVIPMNDHGTVVFLTASQQRTLWGLQLGAVIIGAVGGILLMRGRGKGN